MWWKGVGGGGLQPRARGLQFRGGDVLGWGCSIDRRRHGGWKGACISAVWTDAISALSMQGCRRRGHASLQPGLLQSRRHRCKDAGEGGGGWIHAMMEPGAGARRAPWEGDICGGEGGGMGVWQSRCRQWKDAGEGGGSCDRVNTDDTFIFRPQLPAYHGQWRGTHKDIRG
jgi:hypothetical protein